MTGIGSGDKSSEASKAALAEQLLLARGLVRIRAFGVSMLPSIWPGDVLTVQSARTSDVRVGDIVAVSQNDRWVVHRVTRRSAGQFITRGDCIAENDQPVGMEDVLGKVVAIARESKEFAPKRSLTWFQEYLAWLLCHSDRFRNFMLNLQRSREQRVRSEVQTKFKPTTAS